MRVNVRLLGVYVLCLSLSFLAGVYFGPVLLFIFALLLVLPLAFVLLTVLPFIAIHVEQKWGKSMPIRGESTSLAILVVNSSIFPAHGIKLVIENPDEAHQSGMESLSLHLPPLANHTTRLNLQYSHRGVYLLGVRSVQMEDPLGLLTLERKFHAQTFVVYPRLYELHSFSTVIDDIHGRASGKNGHGTEDPSLFVQLREYRDGESIRHISWRKYASTGRPYLREYERQQKNGAVVYLDSRPGNSADPKEQEDTSIEIFLAIMRYLIIHEIPVVARVPGNREFEQSLQGNVDFNRVLQSAVRARFIPKSDLLSAMSVDSREGVLDRKIVILITHHFDATVRTAMTGGVVYAPRLILNTCGMGTSDQDIVCSEVPSAFHDRIELCLVDSTERILSVLEERRNERAIR